MERNDRLQGGGELSAPKGLPPSLLKKRERLLCLGHLPGKELGAVRKSLNNNLKMALRKRSRTAKKGEEQFHKGFFPEAKEADIEPESNSPDFESSQGVITTKDTGRPRDKIQRQIAMKL